MTEKNKEKLIKILRESKTSEEVIKKIKKSNMDEKVIDAFKEFMFLLWVESAKLHFSDMPIINDLVKKCIPENATSFEEAIIYMENNHMNEILIETLRQNKWLVMYSDDKIIREWRVGLAEDIDRFLLEFYI